jgi:hypothetical protein
MNQLTDLIFADPVQGPDAPLAMDMKARDLRAGDLVQLYHYEDAGRWTGHWCSILSIHPLFGDERRNLHVRHTDGTHREVTVRCGEFAQTLRYFPTTTTTL